MKNSTPLNYSRLTVSLIARNFWKFVMGVVPFAKYYFNGGDSDCGHVCIYCAKKARDGKLPRVFDKGGGFYIAVCGLKN